MKELTDAAREWIAGDPDEASAAQLEEMIDAGDAESLKLAMGGRLEFGTAGIRGRVGPGSNQMNRAVVIKTTRGLAEFLLERHEGPPGSPVIVGF
ncbi:MAG: phospho-sugar mutase, partial [Acidimicrobiia bacterium]|nr:phospho-sugar mutase [Acidimicrobiia bacterium]